MMPEEQPIFNNQILDTSLNQALGNSLDPFQANDTEFSPNQMIHLAGEMLIDAWENQGDAKQALVYAATSIFNDNFTTNAEIVFGESFDVQKAQALGYDILTGESGVLPDVEFLSNVEMKGALGAYAESTKTIYINSDFLIDNADNPGAIGKVLVEEKENFIEAYGNPVDSNDDESEILAVLVAGDNFKTNELQSPKLEDDSTTLIVDGQELTVEQSFGNNLKLDGVDDYISIDIDVPETEVTHEFRFKTTDTNAGLFSVVDSDLGVGGHDRHIFLEGGNLKTRLWNTEIIQSTGLNLADGQWHHVAYVIGASAGGQKLYVDGELVASGNKISSNFNWQKRINLGFSNDAQNNFLNGEIDDVRIWNKTLSQSQIQSSMDKELAGNETGLI
ncbi:MAG: LamG domain-containing protein, partial [Cyanobacteria bacterium J06633_8]